ncbi:MAG TPA: LuxR C-terminal-related transcriptional regulator [Acidimicrobiales bacterium]|nr:LuxR C-terminal-related transcriptional regulator [Acidimicrobiales bacterium]
MSTSAPALSGVRIEAKVRAPRPSRVVVRRSRLESRLLRGAEPPLTLVSAPAGFGKTTLLAEWFADRGRPTAWLSLDASDSDASGFWSNLIASIQKVVPEAGVEALSLLAAGTSATQAAAASLLNDLEAFATDLVVVLDDYHFIESPEVHESLTFLLEYLPAQVHFVIASRADPALPLARMRARGELLEVRAADLRFTTEEAAAYFREAMGIDLSAAEVGALEARTEGWIAALQLAALSMRGRDNIAEFIDRFAGDDRFVVDYLATEVLERQDEDVREFLLDTCILTRLTGPLCDAVTGRTDGTATLEALERANLFVVPLDDRRVWYRYHHLFADVLRARLGEQRSDRARELHRRASEWYDAHDDPAEAIAHALAAENFERAAEILERAASMLDRMRQEASTRRWLDALPAEVLRERPVLCVALAGARLRMGDTTGVDELLTAAESHLAAPTHALVSDQHEFARLATQAATLRAGLALLGGDVPGAIAHAQRALEVSDTDDHLAQGSANGLLGLASWALGDIAAARPRYVAAIPHLDAAGNFADVLGMHLGLADIELAQGALGNAKRTLERGLEHALHHPGLRGTADMHVGLSEVFLERNQLAEAAQQLQMSSDLGEHAGLPQHAYRWRVATAWLRFAEGDIAGALDLLNDARRVFNTDFSPAVRPVDAIVARLELARGNVGAARQWATDRGLTAQDETAYVHEYEHLTLARVLLAEGAPDDARRLLDRLRDAAETGGRGGALIEILMLQALVHHSFGDASAAERTLVSALRAAEAERYIRVVIDAGPTTPELLQAIPATEPAARFAREVLAAIRAPAPVPTAAPSAPRFVDELSSRELDVLRLLKSDLSGPAIAAELLVSLNTFRTHTKNIYMKLGVTSRREAVSRAGELGL